MKKVLFNFMAWCETHCKELLLFFMAILVVVAMSVVLSMFSTRSVEVSCYSAAFLGVFGAALLIHRFSHRSMSPNYAFAYVISLFMVVFVTVLWGFIFGAKNSANVLLGTMGAWGVLGWLGLYRMEQKYKLS